MAGTGVIRKKLQDNEIINLLKRGPLTTKQIAARTGRAIPSIYKTLGKAYDDGLIDHTVVDDEENGRKSCFWSIKK
jgi:transcription initiation factor IIE alpha subunit